MKRAIFPRRLRRVPKESAQFRFPARSPEPDFPLYLIVPPKIRIRERLLSMCFLFSYFLNKERGKIIPPRLNSSFRHGVLFRLVFSFAVFRRRTFRCLRRVFLLFGSALFHIIVSASFRTGYEKFFKNRRIHRGIQNPRSEERGSKPRDHEQRKPLRGRKAHRAD